MAQIVVFGVTGYAGGSIAAELRDRGHEVVGVARGVSKGTDGTTVTGSIHDTAFVREVVGGADHIVVAVRAQAAEQDGPGLVDALPALVQSAVAEGARLSFVGGAGSLHVSEGGSRLVDTPEFPDAYKGEALAHADVLKALRTTDATLDWFYVSPAATFGSWNAGERTGTFRIGDDLLLTDRNGVSAISGADFAIAFVDEIEMRRHDRRRFCVAY